MSRNNKLGKSHENSHQNGTHGTEGAWGKEVRGQKMLPVGRGDGK